MVINRSALLQQLVLRLKAGLSAQSLDHTLVSLLLPSQAQNQVPASPEMVVNVQSEQVLSPAVADSDDSYVAISEGVQNHLDHKRKLELVLTTRVGAGDSDALLLVTDQLATALESSLQALDPLEEHTESQALPWQSAQPVSCDFSFEVIDSSVVATISQKVNLYYFTEPDAELPGHDIHEVYLGVMGENYQLIASIPEGAE
ncbi:hypothetical protein SG34_025570 [Thalassomonas viridans]|uniref:Uncharacterized protein n=1 Tax=Thalassomonas viridans TaxID=137584 RepID=A0AAE9Z254_9GAMM|nr:hypothetical protein [Thalassomonas viridans]WDE04659.1 hypothetical protein SG34_025570 [Thalassomonas viridans]